ncbi:MAG: cytidylate kinase family protein [Desulfobacterales bacterium]|jgi:cytidylate kinase
MPIIIISADDAEVEKSVAQKVARTLDYHLLDEGIIAAVAATHQIDPEKLSEALEKPPSLFKSLSSGQWRYHLACIEADVLDRLLADNIVCCGLAAHLYVIGVSHGLKVRIFSGKSGESLKNRAQQRKKWSLAAYNEDETDLSRYDLVINLDQIDPSEAVKTIAGAARYRRFQVMTYSMKCLSDLALAAKVNVALLKTMTDISVQARDGSVIVSTKAGSRQKRKKIETIKELAGKIDGVRYVEVHVKKNILGATV